MLLTAISKIVLLDEHGRMTPYIPRLLEGINGADMIIGSRFLGGQPQTCHCKESFQ